MAARDREIQELKARVAGLEGVVREGKRQAAPFQRRKLKGNPKKPGRKAGEGRFSRRLPPPKEDWTNTVPVPLGGCPCCGQELTDRKVHEHFQTDLPPVGPVTTRFLTESGYCGRCRKRVASTHPDLILTGKGAAAVGLGPRARSLAADLKHRLGVPYAKIADHLRHSFGLPVTVSGLCQSDARLAAALRPTYDLLLEALRCCEAVHADETGWRIGVLSAWLWVFTSRQITVYATPPSRGHEVVVKVLGREFRGVLHSDCFLAYDAQALAGWLKQKCLGHLLKDLSKMEAEKTRGAVRFPRNVAAVLREAFQLREERAALGEEEYRARKRDLEQRLDPLIAESRRFSDWDNERMAKRLRKQRQHLFTFLEQLAAEPTNNRAERALRPAVITRKTGACNKTRRGADTHAVLSSILATARQQGRNSVSVVADLLTGTPPADLIAASARSP